MRCLELFFFACNLVKCFSHYYYCYAYIQISEALCRALVRSMCEMLFLCGSNERAVVASLGILDGEVEGSRDNSNDEVIYVSVQIQCLYIYIYTHTYVNSIYIFTYICKFYVLINIYTHMLGCSFMFLAFPIMNSLLFPFSV